MSRRPALRVLAAVSLAFLVGRRSADWRDDTTVGRGAEGSATAGQDAPQSPSEPPSMAGVPSAEALRVDGSTDAEPAASQRARRRRWWTVPLAVLCLVFVIATAVLLLPVIKSGDLPAPTGGVLLFVEEDSDPSSDSVAASVDAELWQTGWPGVSLLRLTLDFEERTPGLHWYVIASGQYAPPASLPEPAYCVYWGRKGADGAVRCPVDDAAGGINVRYRAGGLAAARDGQAYPISDYDGYDDSASLVLEGRLSQDVPSGFFGDLTVSLPIRTPARLTAGSETYGALAPIAAYNLGDYGSGDVALRPLLEEADRYTAYAERATGAPIEPMSVTSVAVELDEDLGFREVASARPPVVSDDRLAWTDPELRRLGARFVLTDPLAANTQLIRTFLAGITGSAALTFAGLLLEPFLRRRAGFG